VLELRPEGHRLHLGGWDDYQEKLARSEPVSSVPTARPADTSSQTSREEAKKRQALLRKLEREEEALLAELGTLEQEQKALETKLSDPAVYSSGSLSKEVQADLTANADRQAQLNQRWEAVALELERARR